MYEILFAADAEPRYHEHRFFFFVSRSRAPSQWGSPTMQLFHATGLDSALSNNKVRHSDLRS